MNILEEVWTWLAAHESDVNDKRHPARLMPPFFLLQMLPLTIHSARLSLRYQRCGQSAPCTVSHTHILFVSTYLRVFRKCHYYDNNRGEGC